MFYSMHSVSLFVINLNLFDERHLTACLNDFTDVMLLCVCVCVCVCYMCVRESEQASQRVCECVHASVHVHMINKADRETAAHIRCT